MGFLVFGFGIGLGDGLFACVGFDWTVLYGFTEQVYRLGVLLGLLVLIVLFVLCWSLTWFLDFGFLVGTGGLVFVLIWGLGLVFQCFVVLG